MCSCWTPAGACLCVSSLLSIGWTQPRAAARPGRRGARAQRKEAQLEAGVEERTEATLEPEGAGCAQAQGDVRKGERRYTCVMTCTCAHISTRVDSRLTGQSMCRGHPAQPRCIARPSTFLLCPRPELSRSGLSAAAALRHSSPQLLPDQGLPHLSSSASRCAGVPHTLTPRSLILSSP
jgi:hypothetical protein